MKTESLAQCDWTAFFDQLSKSIVGKHARIEVRSLEIGSQVEVDDLQLFGVTYDPKSDLIEVAMDGLDHMIRGPKEVKIIRGEKGVEAIDIVNRDGQEQLLKLCEPLQLSPPK
jgi:hypothetical protein